MTKRFYMDEETKKLFEEGEWCKSHKVALNTNVVTVKKGIVLSPQKAVKDDNLFSSEVGVLDENYNYIPNSGMNNYEICDFNLPENMDYIDKDVIYCGAALFHYGHFLLQSTARLYYYLQNRDKDLPIVFSAFKKHLPKYIKEFLKLLDIPSEKIIIVDKPTQFRNVICPPLSSEYHKNWSEEFILPFQMAAKNVEPAKIKKVYLSRKHWNGIAKCLGEEDIESIFNKNGFTSVEMEKLSLSEQIALIKGADVLAGINGTAFHNILFGSKNKEIIILNRNEKYDSQYIVNEAMDADCKVLKVYANPLPVLHARGPFIVGLTDYLKEFLADNDYVYSNKIFNPQKHLKEFMERYCQTYLNNDDYKFVAKNYNVNLDIEFMLSLMTKSRYTKFNLVLYKILYKLSFGNFRAKYKSKYAMLKSVLNKKSEYKY